MSSAVNVFPGSMTGGKRPAERCGLTRLAIIAKANQNIRGVEADMNELEFLTQEILHVRHQPGVKDGIMRRAQT